MILGEEAQRRSSKRWIPEAAGGAGQQAEEGAGAAGEVAGLEVELEHWQQVVGVTGQGSLNFQTANSMN